ncbi:MAG: carboxypeptidase-like regulatory domain-containing protein [Pseudobdellovibrio sp.]
MKRLRLSVQFTILFLAFTSCTHIWVAPQFIGRVIDMDGKPIGNVVLQRNINDKIEQVAISSTDGRFSVPAVQEKPKNEDALKNAKASFTFMKNGYRLQSKTWLAKDSELQQKEAPEFKQKDIVLQFSNEPSDDHVEDCGSKEILFKKYAVITSLKSKIKNTPVKSTDWQNWLKGKHVSIPNKPNFAGYYKLIRWACGKSCERFAVIDSRTGKIINLDVTATVGAQFQLKSSLLIIDPVKNVKAQLKNKKLLNPIDTTVYYDWKKDRLQPICKTTTLKSSK